jgi:acyl carrier protein
MVETDAKPEVDAELAQRVDHEVREFLAKKAPQHREAIQQMKPTEQIWGNVDSLLLLALVGHLEKTFKFKVAPKDFTPENFSSIDRIAGFVQRMSTAA